MLIVNCRTRVLALKRELQKALHKDLSSCKDARRISAASHEPLATRLTAMLLGLSEKTVAKVCTQLGKVDPAPPRPRFKAIAEPPAERLSSPPEGGEQMLCRHVSSWHNAIGMQRFLRVSLVNASRWQRCFASKSGSLAGAFPLPRGNNNSCMYYVIHVMLIVKHPAIVTLRFHQ